MGYPPHVCFPLDSDRTMDIAGGPVRATNGLMRRSKRHLQSPILTAQEQTCFASSGAQKRSINGHFSVIFEKPRVAVQAQNFCFKSPILRPAVGQQPEHGCRCGRRWHPNWQIAGELLRVVRNSLLGPNGVSEWVWQACASRETIGGGQPFSLSSKSYR